MLVKVTNCTPYTKYNVDLPPQQDKRRTGIGMMGGWKKDWRNYALRKR